jgi:hypothetical protein
MPDIEESYKEYDARANAASVIEEPPLHLTSNGNSPYPPTFDGPQIFFLMERYANEILPWGGGTYKARDAQLRSFITEENIFASALGIVCSRNATFGWHLNGSPRTLRRMQDILETADRGHGWESLIVKTSIDLYSQDAGAVWELVREEDSESSPIIAINHLDIARCYHTGVWESPIIYQDRRGRYHLLKWYQVVTFAEMPCSIETFEGLQYCALTRFLRAAQERKSVSIRDYERTNGRHAKSIHLVQGITTQQLTDAITRANSNADAAGLMRYMDPIVVGSISPQASVDAKTIELTSPPEGYERDEYFKEYIAMLAMAFLTDYQEFSPLPGGNLGTSTQSQILHLKNRGKGPGIFRRLITHAINFRVMPQNCEFHYDDPDFEAEKTEAEVKKLRAQTRQIRVTSQEITPEVARQIANDEGDLRQEYLALMGDVDRTDNLMVDSESPADNQIDEQIAASQMPVSRPKPVVREQTSASQGFGERARRLF